MWRPTGWDAEILTKENLPLFKWGTIEYGHIHRGIEIGADAMLKALREQCDDKVFDLEEENGLWVFIPDDKVSV